MDREDALVLLALALITAGSFLAWPPLGFLVPGLLLLTALLYRRLRRP